MSATTDDWIEIPIPPSANALWAPRVIAGRFMGMHKTARYNAWLQTAVLLLRAGLPTNLTPPLALRIRVIGGHEFNGNRRDLDNIIKPTLDAVKVSGRIADDVSELVSVIDASYQRGSRKQPGICRVQVTEHRV